MPLIPGVGASTAGSDLNTDKQNKLIGAKTRGKVMIHSQVLGTHGAMKTLLSTSIEVQRHILTDDCYLKADGCN